MKLYEKYLNEKSKKQMIKVTKERFKNIKKTIKEIEKIGISEDTLNKVGPKSVMIKNDAIAMEQATKIGYLEFR